MILKVILIICVMFIAFLAVYGICALVALMLAEETKKRCQNCRWFDKPMTCCRRTWAKVVPDKTTCENFQRGAEV